MFHVKQRHLGLLAGASMLGLLAISCGGTAASPRGWAEPVQSGTTTMVSTGRGRLDGLDGSSNRIWRFPNNWEVENDDLKGIYGPPLVSKDGSTVFFSDYNGHVYAFKPADAQTGDGSKADAAEFDLGGPSIGGMVVNDAGTSIYATAGAKLIQIDWNATSRTFTKKAEFETGEDIWSQPVLLSGDRLLISSLDGKLYSLNSTDISREPNWVFDNEGSGLVSTPAVIGDVALVSGFDSKVHAVNISDGSLKWTFQASYWVWNEPIVEQNRVIFGDFNSRLFGLNVADGTEVWSVELKKGPIVGSPIVVSGVIVVGTEDGWLLGVDLATQAIKWQTEVGKSLNADLILGSGGLVLIAPSGCVTPEGSENSTYFNAVEAATGSLKAAGGVC